MAKSDYNLSSGQEDQDFIVEEAEENAKLPFLIAKDYAEAAIRKKVAEAVQNFVATFGYELIAFFIIIIIIAAIWGACGYYNDKINELVFSQIYEDEFFKTKYYDQAVAILDNIRNPSSTFGSSMTMLSRSDIEKVLEHVVENNETVTYMSLVMGQYYRSDPKPGSNEWGNYYSLATGGDYTGWIQSYQTFFFSEEELALSSPSGIEQYFDGDCATHYMPIIALCEMKAEDNQMNPNRYQSESSNGYGWQTWQAENPDADLANDVKNEIDMTGYYINESEITAICNLFDYHFVCYPNDEFGRDYVQIGKAYDDGEFLTYDLVLTGYDFWNDRDQTWAENIIGHFVNPESYYEYQTAPAVLSTAEVPKWTYKVPQFTMADGSTLETSNFIIDNDWNYIAPWNVEIDQDIEDTTYVPSLAPSDRVLVNYANTYGLEKAQTLRAYNSFRNPSLAPKKIYNCFISLEYEYEPVTEGSEAGADRCTSLTVTIDVEKLTKELEHIIPSFTWHHFISLMEISGMPEEDLAIWRNLYELYKQGEQTSGQYEDEQSGNYVETVTGEERLSAYKKVYTFTEFPGVGTYVGIDSQMREAFGAGYYDSEDRIYIGTRKAPYEDTIIYEDYVNILPGARADINRSDNLSEEQIIQILYRMYELVYTGAYRLEDGTQIANPDSINAYMTAQGAAGFKPEWLERTSWLIQEDGHEKQKHNHYQEWYTEGLISHAHRLWLWQNANEDLSLTAVLAATLIQTPSYSCGNANMNERIRVVENPNNTSDLFNINYAGNANSAWITPTTNDPYTYGSTILYPIATSDNECNFEWYLKNLDYIAERMRSSGHGYGSYFELEFGQGFISHDSDEYTAIESQCMTDSLGNPNNYTVWWLDRFMDTEEDGISKNIGAPLWCNRVTEKREILLNAIGKTCSSTYIWPVNCSNHRVNSSFGSWISPRAQRNPSDGNYHRRNHGGIDLYGAAGTEVICPANGIVENIACGGGYGNYIVIRFDDGNQGTLAHMSGYDAATGEVYANTESISLHPSITYAGLQVGQGVYQGQVIGIVGNTGDSEGAHLHFTLLNRNNAYIDPAPYLGLSEGQQTEFYDDKRIPYYRYYDKYRRYYEGEYSKLSAWDKQAIRQGIKDPEEFVGYFNIDWVSPEYWIVGKDGNPWAFQPTEGAIRSESFEFD